LGFFTPKNLIVEGCESQSAQEVNPQNIGCAD